MHIRIQDHTNDHFVAVPSELIFCNIVLNYRDAWNVNPWM
jgi:hypothetical protein